MTPKETQFKSALLEAALWEKSLTEKERTSISFQEARKIALDRVYKKYINKMLK